MRRTTSRHIIFKWMKTKEERTPDKKPWCMCVELEVGEHLTYRETRKIITVGFSSVI